MPPSRRSVLVALAPALAGCTTFDPRGTPTGHADSGTGATSTADGPGARTEIETARERLRAALDAYVGDAGPDATLLDVTAAGQAPFPRADVIEACRSADAAIQSGRSKAAEGESSTLDALASASDFLAGSARLQSDLAAAAGALRDLRSAVYANERPSARTRRSAVEDALESSNPHADALGALDPSTVGGALERLDAALVRAKLTQFEREDRGLWDLSSALASVLSGSSAIEAGWAAWTEGAYGRAEFEFGAAVEDFAAAGQHLDEEWAASLRAIGEEVTSVVDALHAGSTRLQAAAVEARDGDRDLADRRVEEACGAFRASGTVSAEVRAVQPILERG